MRNCKGCKYAVWHKTKTGRISPTGYGKCSYEYKVPPLPASMHWLGVPQPVGGYIDRHGELQVHCTYYTREEDKKAS